MSLEDIKCILYWNSNLSNSRYSTLKYSIYYIHIVSDFMLIYTRDTWICNAINNTTGICIVHIYYYTTIDLMNREITYHNVLTLSCDDDFIISKNSISQGGVSSLLDNNGSSSLILAKLIREHSGELRGS